VIVRRNLEACCVGCSQTEKLVGRAGWVLMREGEVAFAELDVEDSCSEHSLGRMAHSRLWA